MQVGKPVNVNLKTALQLLVVLHPERVEMVIFLPPVPLPLSGRKKLNSFVFRDHFSTNPGPSLGFGMGT